MVDSRTIDRTVIVEASRPAMGADGPESQLEDVPPVHTGLTTPQQWALYYSRKRRRQRLGVLPSTPAPAALYLSGLNQVTEGAAPGTVIGNLQVIGGTGTYTFTKTTDTAAKFTLAAGVLSTAGTWDYEAATFYPVTITADNGAGSVLVRTINVRVVQISAPVLTQQMAVVVSSTQATLSVTTDVANGTLYTVVTTSAQKPTAAQVKAGQNALGTAAVWAGNQVISTVGNKTATATVLPATSQFAYFMHEGLPAEQSDVEGAQGITTPPSMYATLDVAPSTGLITMSNGNLTATRNGTGAAGTARSSKAVSSGKYYFEMANTLKSSGTTHSLGVSWTTATDANVASGITTVTTEPATNTFIFSNSVDQAKSLGTAASNDVYGFALDFDARLAWIRRNAGNWNGDAAANPATGVNGVVIGTGSFAPVIYLSSSAGSDSVTVNFGASAFVGAVPSGFTAGWPV